MKIFIYCLFFTLLSSCSNYIARYHNSLDRVYNNVPNNNASITNTTPATISNPVTYNAEARPQLNQSQPTTLSNNSPKRYRADDLIDSGSSGSLWANSDASFLFATNIQRKIGDLVVINVLSKLRDEISSEFQRMYPERKPLTAKDDKATKKDAQPQQEENIQQQTKPEDDQQEQIFDKISAVISEVVNQDYYLIKGKKEITYKRNRHMVDIQGIISKNDISSDNSIASDRFLETTINILR